MSFVHLHNHSDFSMLDGATRINDMVKRAVDLGMPAVALTDHGYMYGIPNLGLACDKYNHKMADYKQWTHDIECFTKGWEIEEPPADDPEASPHDRAHAQWEKDMAAWEKNHEIADVEAVKPSPLIKPIFGCEAYFITDDAIERSTKQRRYHMILLAKNQQGYVNLMRMMSEAATSMFYYKPRTTLDMLKKYHEGIICTSACVQGIIQQRIIDGEFEEAEEWLKTFVEIFGDDFYLEIQDHGNDFRGGWNDRSLDEYLVKLGEKYNVKIIATNDFHYLTREDAHTQDIMMCIGMNANIADEGRMRMEGSEYYMKTEEEMRELFSWYPQACDNTVELAEKCDVELEWGQILLPEYPLDEGETNESQFRRECEKGLAERYGEDWKTARPDVVERFEYEYKIVCEKGFAAYFLIVQDYVRWAKEQGIGVGPGRGSAAGAIVAYAMDITSFDPLENGLMFERFLSPQRTEMPDIDMDFDDERRLEVIEYTRQRYGSEQVTHVITYSTIKAKQAINDACRVLGEPVFMGQKLSKLIVADPKVSLSGVLNKTDKHPEWFNQEFQDAYNAGGPEREIIEAALAIEGLTRGEGVHACAVLIAPGPVHNFVPTKLDTKGGVEITQYEGHTVADMGLLKMDFLGLRTLTVISKARENIRRNFGVDIDPDKIPFDDEKIFELLSSGHTAGVFQVESDGMTATIKSMKPREYKHVVALIALFRPGPLGAGMVTDYIDRMNGKKDVVYYDERLASVLEETYGTIVYQEQVMQISIQMSGFSAGESDKVRKAVAKKKIDLMTKTITHWDDGTDETMHDHWVNGAERNGYSKEVAQSIWEDVLKFASYAFNKSHSAGYAILVMQTAWLKAHYPNEFMAAVLTSYMGKTDKIVHYVNACRHEGIKIMQPDINESGRDFTATKDGIRFGFAGIRGVGEGAAEVIMKEREEHGDFTSLHDFVERVDGGQVNRRVIEALIKAGAFDSTGYGRRECMNYVDKNNPTNILDEAAKKQKYKASGQASFFDLCADDETSDFYVKVPDATGLEWDRYLKLALEKEVLGIYVSDHPLKPFEYALSKARTNTIPELESYTEMPNPAGGSPIIHYKVKESTPVWVAGMVSKVEKKVTKKGDTMAIVTLEDLEGELSVVVFPKTFKDYGEVLFSNLNEAGEAEGDVFVRIQGRVDRGDRGSQFLASEIQPLVLDEASNKQKVVEVHIPKELLTQATAHQIREICSRYNGFDRVSIMVEMDNLDTFGIQLPITVDASNVVLRAELRELVSGHGEIVVG